MNPVSDGDEFEPSPTLARLYPESAVGGYTDAQFKADADAQWAACVPVP